MNDKWVDTDGYSYLESSWSPHTYHISLPAFRITVFTQEICNKPTEELVDELCRMVNVGIKRDLTKTIAAIKKEISNGKRP